MVWGINLRVGAKAHKKWGEKRGDSSAWWVYRSSHGNTVLKLRCGELLCNAWSLLVSYIIYCLIKNTLYLLINCPIYISNVHTFCNDWFYHALKHNYSVVSEYLEFLSRFVVTVSYKDQLLDVAFASSFVSIFFLDVSSSFAFINFHALSTIFLWIFSFRHFNPIFFSNWLDLN